MADEAPNAEIASANQALDVSSAAALLNRATNPAEGRERAPNGQFAAKQPETVALVAEEPAKVVDLKTGKEVQPEPVAEQQPAAEEEDYFEFPAEEEGKEPRKVKLEDVLAAYEELPKLKAEYENVKKAAPPPADYIAALQETVQERSKYLAGLEQIAKITNPQDPPLSMLNPQHQHYDPDRYYALKSQFEQGKAQLAQINQMREQAEQQQARENEVLVKAHLARENEALEKAWPEYKSDRASTLRTVAEGLMKTYGFTTQEINNIADHRQLLVIKDALELRALKAKKDEAVQVVRQKPKIVKGAARTTTNPQAASVGNAMSKLQTSNSTADAVRALKALKI